MALTRLHDPDAAAAWLAAGVTGALSCDSRTVAPGDGFVAWPGQRHDGRAFVAGALAAGAAACLVEDDGVEAFGFDDARIATLRGLKAGAGAVAHRWYGCPSDRLDVVAVTGTNGKTSSAWWVAQAATRCGRRCGVMGTLGIGDPGAVVPTGLTTPDPIVVHRAMHDWVARGYAACALEASSIGLVEQRLNGLAIDVAVFTNFTQDHLDHHGDMAAYWAAKRRLFDWPGLRAAVVNIDDEHGHALAAELAGGALDLWTVSASSPARLQARHVRYEGGTLAFELAEGDAQATARTVLIGQYNVHNLLGVAGALRALGVPLADVAAALPTLTPVPGRLQQVGGGADAPAVVVDYAHTPDALEQVLHALAPLAAARGGALWCVFGCGGDRDPTKRPLMGAIASRLADHVVITSDNPRSEPPGLVLAQVLAGASPCKERERIDVIEDRAEAIAHAVLHARAADVVLVAGKGHEDYQEVAGVRRPFSDVAQAELRLRERADRGGRA
ncbi:MAG: UDP-N-acetylmuramoyl-L-alanyl-D-glutamate--2,6-diaminopimelate ligase [Rubrivivax sp.]|nr:UDP-N-acetylmuramoyl-L-alanyl-D-glutamate--2,6-diaminopimelate ligase [Rubrivivax sp.]